MNLEREKERKSRQAEQQAKIRRIEERRARLAAIKSDLSAQFAEHNVWARGKKLEAILNRLFAVDGILVREAFTLSGDEGEGIVEQIDGVIDIDGEYYLVELKWWQEALGVAEVSQHLVRVFTRGCARGIFISASGYTDAAVSTCKDSLHKIVVVLSKLEEIVMLLEQEGDMREFWRKKIQAAIVAKNPLHEPLRVP